MNNAAIDETIHYLKVRSLKVDTFIDEALSGMDTLQQIKKENLELYDAINSLQKLLKAEGL